MKPKKKPNLKLGRPPRGTALIGFRLPADTHALLSKLAIHDERTARATIARALHEYAKKIAPGLVKEVQ